MKLLNKIKKIFLYAGLTKEEYSRISDDISVENRNMLFIFCMVSGVVVLAITLYSLIPTSLPVSDNTVPYVLLAGLMFGIALLLRFRKIRNPRSITVLMYFFQCIIYAFSFIISLLHWEYPAVSAVVFLFVCPMVFLDRPLNVGITTTIAVAVFCVLTFRCKESAIAGTDMWNMISFGLLAMVINMFVMQVRARTLLQRKKMDYMSSHDLMTGLKNRNCYEQEIPLFFGMCKKQVTCVYADVNGLHAVNNTQGHEAGDEMLRTVASSLTRAFGDQYGYRTGGDEFIFFVLDGSEEIIQEKVDAIHKDLENRRYAVAFGVYSHEKQADDIVHLIQESEKLMYQNKREYYQRPENNRRSRS